MPYIRQQIIPESKIQSTKLLSNDIKNGIAVNNPVTVIFLFLESKKSFLFTKSHVENKIKQLPNNTESKVCSNVKNIISRGKEKPIAR